MKYHALFDSLYKRPAMPLAEALRVHISDRTSEQGGAIESIKSKQEEVIRLVVLIAARLPEAQQRSLALAYGLKEAVNGGKGG